MGIGTGINQDKVGVAIGSLNLIDDGAFAIGLEVLELAASFFRLSLQRGDQGLQVISAVNRGLTDA